ncbi:DUF1194 domain-containing protein, partial [Mesorhizobium sp. M7A.F.Ca.CA.004.04.1.1]
MFGSVYHQDAGPLSFRERVRATGWGILTSAGSISRVTGILAVSMFWAISAHAANVDVAIVFAVDFSSSIDPKIADMQREGHAAALTSPEIIAAISRNYVGCIGVAYFEWSSPGHARVVLPWT